MMTNQDRVPKGVPNGGEFAGNSHGESGVTLSAFTNPDTGLPYPVDGDRVRAELTDNDTRDYYDSLSNEDKQLFAIITDPNSDEGKMWGGTRQDQIDECFADFNGANGESVYEARQVFARIRAAYESAPDRVLPGDPDMAIEADEDGDFYGFNTTICLESTGNSTMLARYQSIENITDDDDATGIAAAMGYASVADGNIRALRAEARDKGLLTEDDTYKNLDYGAHISVPSADYEGAVSGAAVLVADGTYDATDEDGEPVRLHLAGGMVRAERLGNVHAPTRSANRAEKVLRGWADELPDKADSSEQARIDRETGLKDALTDLHHWAEANGIDVYDVFDRSYSMYLDEKKNPVF